VRFRARGKDLRVEISMINLIDVMFCVVVFLLLSTTFKQVGSGLGIKLPKSSALVERREEALVVQVTADGIAHFQGRVVSPEELGKELRAALPARSDKTVVVQGDEKAPHGRMVAVYDAIRTSGAAAITVAAVPPESPAPAAP
jgi:biopolymer transport protein ExbD